jgi:hypothetical protein
MVYEKLHEQIFANQKRLGVIPPDTQLTLSLSCTGMSGAKSQSLPFDQAKACSSMSTGGAASVRTFFTPSVARIRGGNAMKAFKITLVASIGAFLFGSPSVASDFAVGGELVSSHSASKCADEVGTEPDAPEGYARLGTAKINGRRVAIYAFQNGARLDDAAGEGRGSADVFDSAGHLIRRFTFRENLNSQPLITEFLSLPAR